MHRASPDRWWLVVFAGSWRSAAPTASCSATASSSPASSAVDGDATGLAAARSAARRDHPAAASPVDDQHACRKWRREAGHDRNQDPSLDARDVLGGQRLQGRGGLLRSVHLPRARQGRLAPQVHRRANGVLRDGSLSRQTRGLQRRQMCPLRWCVDVEDERVAIGAHGLTRDRRPRRAASRWRLQCARGGPWPRAPWPRPTHPRPAENQWVTPPDRAPPERCRPAAR